jgi:hypothetical protein
MMKSIVNTTAVMALVTGFSLAPITAGAQVPGSAGNLDETSGGAAGDVRKDSATPATVVPTPTGPTREADTPPTPGTPQHAAQLEREHKRAVAAGDHANDPLNPASANDLNRQELARAQAQGTGPARTDVPRP